MRCKGRILTYKDHCIDELELKLATERAAHAEELRRVEQERDAQHERAESNWVSLERVKGRFEVATKEKNQAILQRDAASAALKMYQALFSGAEIQARIEAFNAHKPSEQDKGCAR